VNVQQVDEVVKFSRWRHNKTGTTYIVVGFVHNATNGPDDNKVMVLYRETHNEDHVYARTLEQFVDGRFTDVTYPKGS
jgi:hypothetical protein